jgi:4-hydroxy-tetrahydrodipicolinate synthase
MFTGTYTAIVTPFRNGAIDEDALERLIKLQIKGGVDGVVPVGTTGESPTVDYAEHIKIVAPAAGRELKIVASIPVLVL